MSLTDTAARPAPEAGVRQPPPCGDYLQTSIGQVHRLRSLPEAGDGKPALYALHATAYSGRTFAPLMAHLPARHVAALDAPGYGASARPPRKLTAREYSEILLEAIDAAGEPRIDLLGYHTGALFALEMAMLRPELVRRLVLIGIPFYPPGPMREERRRTLAAPMRLSEDLAQFEERWRFFVAERATGVSLAQGYAHFVDELRAYPFGYWAHEAAFTHEPESSLRLATQPTLVLNPNNHLAEPSRRAAALMRDAEVIEMTESHQVLDLAAPQISEHVEAFLSAP